MQFWETAYCLPQKSKSEEKISKKMRGMIYFFKIVNVYEITYQMWQTGNFYRRLMCSGQEMEK